MNGLDPEGILWMRNLLKALAAEGRTVFVSSHLMSEMALTASALIVIGQGRLIADATVAELTAAASRDVVSVTTDDAARLQTLLSRGGVTITVGGPDKLVVAGLRRSGWGSFSPLYAVPCSLRTTALHTLLPAAPGRSSTAASTHH